MHCLGVKVTQPSSTDKQLYSILPRPVVQITEPYLITGQHDVLPSNRLWKKVDENILSRRKQTTNIKNKQLVPVVHAAVVHQDSWLQIICILNCGRSCFILMASARSDLLSSTFCSHFIQLTVTQLSKNKSKTTILWIILCKKRHTESLSN